MTEKDKIFNHIKYRFTMEGFYKTSMDELASDLQISKKTIYKYFPSKELLIAEIVNSEIYITNDTINRIINEKSDVIDKFIRIMEFYTSGVSKYNEKWLRDVQTHLPDLWNEIDKFKSKNIDSILTKLINEGKKEKLIIDYPPEIIINSYINTCREICNQKFLNRYNLSLKDALHSSFSMLINGILTEKGREKYKKMIKSKSFAKNIIM
jgi:hypothetical protein